MREVLVVSLGGSALYERERFDAEKAREIASLLNQTARTHSLVVVVGGGPLAAKAVAKSRAKKQGEFHADLQAIEATRENARRVAKFLKNASVVTKFEQAPSLLKKNKIVVSGGMMPGLTTDSISVLFAEFLGARRVVNVSRVHGIYDSDPRKNARAKKFARLSHDRLVSLAVVGDSRKARENFVFDLVACKLAARSKIALDFVSASNLPMLALALEGERHSGTKVG